MILFILSFLISVLTSWFDEMVASLLSRMARMGEEDSREIRISTPVSVGYSQISERLAAEDDNNSSH